MRWGLRFVLLLTLAAVSACGGDDEPDTPAASVERRSTTTEQTTTTTAPLTPEQEVEAAYLRSWEVYRHALLELDPTELDSAFAGPALEVALQEIEDLRAAGRRARYEIEHDYRVSIANGIGTVVDSYLNHSVVLDAETREPLEPDPNSVLTQVFVLQQIEGTWKVVDIRTSRSS